MMIIISLRLLSLEEPTINVAVIKYCWFETVGRGGHQPDMRCDWWNARPGNNQNCITEGGTSVQHLRDKPIK